MTPAEIGLELRRARRSAGLTQRVLAERMGTSQPAIARAESGLVEPSLDFVDRFAQATGQVLKFGSVIVVPPRDVARRDRVDRAIGDFEFNPWLRGPSEAEQRSLIREGLTRERFERTPPSDAG
jgi:transcriptional regulator with XRE-family HTH domain